jgi:hypothetical protein
VTAAVFEWKPSSTDGAGEDGSIAVMMDEIWTSIAEAHYEGGGPEYIVLPSAMYRKVTALKERELAHGVPLMILGRSIVEG